MKIFLMHVFFACCTSVSGISGAWAQPGDWPEARQNPQLTGLQPLPGAISGPPVTLATYDLGRSRPPITEAALPNGEALGLCLEGGGLVAYDTAGVARWTCHPEYLNFEQIIAVRDLDGDGAVEVLLQAGRPTAPYGAAALVSLADGQLMWRYDVDPMSYGWYLHAGHYLPDTAGEQIVVIMMGYPPDKENGYIALFDFAPGDPKPSQRWRYDFHEYTCFPSFLLCDLDGDGVGEVVVETHSRMWFLDAISGALKHFAKWDVSPANVRSYGHIEFTDLNGDGRDDFLCVANFAQHHEVLLNKDGAMEKAWHYGWDESVTTGKVVTAYPAPVHAVVDASGKQMVVVSMFNAEDAEVWCTRIYDAIDGTLVYRVPDFVAVALHDLDGDGISEILGNVSHDPTQTVTEGAQLVAIKDGAVSVVWADADSVAIPSKANAPLCVRKDGEVQVASFDSGAVVLAPWQRASDKPRKRDVFAAIPERIGPPMPVLLAANVMGDERNELILWRDPAIEILQLNEGQLSLAASYTSSAAPVFADFDGDGVTDMALCNVDASHEPSVEVICPAQDNRALWTCAFPPAGRPGLPQPRKAYLRTGRFTGKPTPDLYLWAGTPIVRSAAIDGRIGTLLWDKGEVPGQERYWGASVNLASVWDFNGDTCEDLVFTNPDFYCVADGKTGEPLLGPLFPPNIFSQPCQGLYTMPVLLARPDADPIVCLVAGHYFQGVMGIKAEPYWHRIPPVGEHAMAREAFLQTNGMWRMGMGRQNGNFACVDVRTGVVVWEMAVGGSVSDAFSCDINGDGVAEFLFGTSHGVMYAIGDIGGAPALLWQHAFEGPVGSAIAADLTGDHLSEIAVPTADGRVHILGAG